MVNHRASKYLLIILFKSQRFNFTKSTASSREDGHGVGRAYFWSESQLPLPRVRPTPKPSIKVQGACAVNGWLTRSRILSQGRFKPFGPLRLPGQRAKARDSIGTSQMGTNAGLAARQKARHGHG